MGKLDEIYYKRLERIREELDSYIESRLPREDAMLSTPIIGGAPLEKKKGGVQDKFLTYMKLNDEDEDAYDDSYLDDEEDECFTPQREEAESEHSPMIQAPRQASAARLGSAKVTPTGMTKIQDFLRKDEKHLKLDEVLEKREESFSTMLLRMIDEKGLKDSDVYKMANIDRRLFSKIRGDEDYMPSKKTAISFCLALQLEIDEAKKLLATAGYTLSASSRFDLIIMYLIETKEYNIHFANIVLDDYGEGTLSR